MPEAAPRLARSAGLFGLATMASRILGLLRDQVLAYYFGATDAMDAFRVAFRVPNLVRDLFAEGAMSAAFVPTFTAALTTGGKARAWALADSVITALLLITGALVVAGVLFTDPIARFYDGGFAAVPGKLELTITLARVMMPFLMLVSVAAVFMGMLNTLGHYFVPALSPAMFNVATILIAVVAIPLAPSLGLEPIMLIAAATLVGGVGQLALQWWPLSGEGYRYRPALAWRDPALRRVLLLMGPGTIGMAATQINVLVNTQFATGQGTGAVSWLEYAFRIMYLPIGLFGVSVAAASTPALARLAALDDLGSMRSTLGQAMRLMLALNLPAMLGLIALAEPIVGLIFERGQFTATDTASTALALRYYALGLVGYSVVRILSPAFYALRMSHVPVTASVIAVALNIGLNMVLVRIMGFSGLALGTSLAAIVNAVIQTWLLRRRLAGLEGRRLATSLVKITVAGLAMMGTAWGSERLLHEVLPGGDTLARAARVFAAIGAAVVVLVVTAALLRVEEVGEARQTIMRRLGRKR